MTIVAICGLAAGSAIAQDQPTREKERTEHRQTTQPRKDTETRKETVRSESETRHTGYTLVPSTRLEGVTVIGADDVRLGQVKDTIIHGGSGRALYVLVTRGMTPAYDQAPPRVVAVPFGAMSWDDEKRLMSTSITETKFNNATSLELDKWNMLREPSLAMNTYKYFEVPNDRFEADRRVYRVNRIDRRDTDDRRDMDDRRDLNNDGKIDDKDRDMDRDRQKEQKAADKEMTKDRTGDKTLGAADADKATFKASDIRNRPLLSRDGNDLGVVNDIVFNAPSGHVAFLVITPASTLNAGEGRIAVPWPHFEVDQTGRLYGHNLDQETVRAAPRIVQNEWGELKIENYNDDVYKRFGYEAPKWERTTTVTRTSSSSTTTRPDSPAGNPNRTNPTDAGSMQSDWRGPYTKAMASGSPRTVKGRIESVTETSSDPRIVVINVKTDDGEVVPVHVAPKNWLDQQSLKLKEGQTVTVTGKDVTMDGKKCTCAREVASGSDRLVIYTDK